MPLSFLDDDQTLRDMLTSRRVLKGIAGRNEGFYPGVGNPTDSGYATPEELLMREGHKPYNPRGIDSWFDTMSRKILPGHPAGLEGIASGITTGDALIAPAAIDSIVEGGQNIGAGRPVQGAGEIALGLLDAADGPMPWAAAASGLGTMIGVGAKNFPHGKLKIAEKMEAGGAGRDEIFQQTQLWRGADEKWRSEIDDSGSAFNQKMFSDALREGTMPRSRELLKNAELEKSYPNMDYPVKPLRGETGASINGHMIELGAIGGGRRKMAHELQHGVSKEEGFAIGGTPEDFSLVQQNLAINKLNEIGDVIGSKDYPPDLLRELYKAQQGGVKDVLAFKKANPEYYGKVNDLLQQAGTSDLNDLYKYYDKISGIADDLSPYNQYLKLADEVQARNVEKRLDWPMWQRQMIPPWMTEDVPLQDQIVRMGSGGASQSVGRIDDAPKMGDISGYGMPDNFIADLKARHPDMKAELSINNQGALVIDRVEVAKGKRSGGIGSKFMDDVTKYADENGLNTVLTAAGDYGGSKAGQKRFYKRHGFVDNSGRNKDFMFRENMIRKPQK